LEKKTLKTFQGSVFIIIIIIAIIIILGTTYRFRLQASSGPASGRNVGRMKGDVRNKQTKQEENKLS
jgi:flagellar basal body-associated protein FliL